jgi:GNAT superfamily N-acetyltransferase
MRSDVRRATIEDIPRLADMMERFVRLGGHEPSRKSVEAYLLWALTEGVVFIGKAGAIGGMMQPLPFDASGKYATELFWWSEGGEGIRLLNAYEKWAKDNGARNIIVSTIDTIESKAARILERRGYTPQETKHVRAI